MLEDKFRIDNHKLIYHPQRVSYWMDGKLIYPIYMEISPVGFCNHRCEFCSVDFMGYQSRKIDTGVLKKRITEFGELGIKSIMFAGEGEPLLHKDIAEITKHTKNSGIDVAFTTNGVLLDEALSENILPVTSWLKVSCNAGNSRDYARIHNTKGSDFDKVLQNLAGAVEIREKLKLDCTLGIQIVLIPSNIDNVESLVNIAGDIGLDYLVVKPYMPHRDNKHTYDINYNKLAHLQDKLLTYNTNSFSVIYRDNAMSKWDCKQKSYTKCLALPFWSYIDAGGNVWGCSVYLNEEEFYYGNIYKISFEEIWNGEKRLESLKWMNENLNISKCKTNCRMDEVNKYLWELKNPSEHVNFI